MAALSGNATHQAAVLAVMATGNAGPLTIDQIDAALPIGRKQIATAAAKLIQRAFIQRLETGVYALTSTGRRALEDGASLTSGPHRGRRKIARHRDTLQQRAWTAMRLNASFTIPDIAMLAARPQDRDATGSLQRFFHRLTRAGYLVEMPRRASSRPKRRRSMRPGSCAASPMNWRGCNRSRTDRHPAGAGARNAPDRGPKPASTDPRERQKTYRSSRLLTSARAG